jgi:hypothetical protein
MKKINLVACAFIALHGTSTFGAVNIIPLVRYTTGTAAAQSAGRGGIAYTVDTVTVKSANQTRKTVMNTKVTTGESVQVDTGNGQVTEQPLNP